MKKYVMVLAIGVAVVVGVMVGIPGADADKEVPETRSGMLCDMYMGQTDGAVRVVVDESAVGVGSRETEGVDPWKSSYEWVVVAEDVSREECVEVGYSEVEREGVVAGDYGVEWTETEAVVQETGTELALETVVQLDAVDWVVEETVVETEAVSDGFVLKSVDGVVLDEGLQRYLYAKLREKGIEWYYDIALCQLYQESRYNYGVVAANGVDTGIAQICVTYWQAYCAESGLPNGNIFDPIDNLYVYTHLMAKNLAKYGGDVDKALSAYFTGDTYYEPQYVNDVKQWLSTVRQ